MTNTAHTPTPTATVLVSDLESLKRKAARVAELSRERDSEHERAELLASRNADARARVAELEAALRDVIPADRDVAAMRELSRRFADNAPILGADKGAAAEIIAEYARFIRIARATLAQS